MASILNQNTDEANARLVKYIGDPARTGDANDAGAVLIRSWPYIAGAAASGSDVKALVEALQAVATYTSPKANNVAYTGTFANSHVEAVDENIEGSNERQCTIVQTLTRVISAASASALAALDARRMRENEILALFEINTGERDRLGLEYRNLNENSMAGLFSETDANYVSTVAQAQDNTVTWSYEDKKFQTQDDRTGTFSLLFRKTAWHENSSSVQAEHYRYTAGYGRKEPSEEVLWPNAASNVATLIYNDAITNENNASACAYHPAAASHKLNYVTRVPGNEGNYRVERVTYIPNNTGSSAWPPGADEFNVGFIVKRYRPSATLVRTWSFRKLTHLTATGSDAEDWYQTLENTYTAERGSAINMKDESGMKWIATFIYQSDDTGWVTDVDA